jgi:hypothetical protein
LYTNPHIRETDREEEIFSSTWELARAEKVTTQFGIIYRRRKSNLCPMKILRYNVEVREHHSTMIGKR